MSETLRAFLEGSSDTITRADLLSVLGSAYQLGRDHAPGRSPYGSAAMSWSWVLNYLGVADEVREAAEVAQPGWRHVGENQPLGSTRSPIGCSILHE